MLKIYRLGDAAEILKRKQAIPPGVPAQVWGDVLEQSKVGLLRLPKFFWVDEETKMVLDGLGDPLKPLFAIDGEKIPIFSLKPPEGREGYPSETSVRVRVIAGHGIGVAWLQCDPGEARLLHEPSSPRDAFFFLKRVGFHATHLWRLFRSREDARWFVNTYSPEDPQASTWPDLLPADDFEDFLRRYRLP
ncbi:MAG: hypothetical protein HY347_07235 [candidate division NC10 bacterium]|nr:hypothetical protein [candidate division NC10 bacterium]